MIPIWCKSVIYAGAGREESFQHPKIICHALNSLNSINIKGYKLKWIRK